MCGAAWCAQGMEKKSIDNAARRIVETLVFFGYGRFIKSIILNL